MQNEHGRVAAEVWRILILRRKLFGAIIPSSRCLAGRLSWIPLKCCFLWRLCVVTSHHVTKMAVTLFDPPWLKPRVIRKLHGSVFCTSE